MSAENLYTGKLILLTQGEMRHLGGSEVVTLELAEFFTSRGAQVIIATNACAGIVSDIVGALANVAVYEMHDPALDDALADRLPDLCWIHHSLIPDRVLRAAHNIPLVFNHLSGHLPVEFALSPEIECAVADVILFNSPETRDNHLLPGTYDEVPRSLLRLFENPAPDAFYDVEKTTRERPLVLVVSNHAPEEVLEAVALLAGDFDVNIVGNKEEVGAIPQRVTPDLLATADAVITIGKTVQYALVAGVPVYCYDHFGGPGWLSEDSFDLAAYRNFSGRGFTRKTAPEIVGEFQDGLAKAKTTAQALRFRAAQQYLLSGRMDEVVSLAMKPARQANPLSDAILAAHSNRQRALSFYWRSTSTLADARTTLLRELAALRNEHEAVLERHGEMLGNYAQLRSKVDSVARIPGVRTLLRAWRALTRRSGRRA